MLGYKVQEVLQIISGAVLVIVAGVLVLTGQEVPSWVVGVVVAIWGAKESVTPVRNKRSNSSEGK